jgi:hypothetical protein
MGKEYLETWKINWIENSNQEVLSILKLEKNQT